MLNETPLKLNVGEYTINVPDAPSSGPVLALILNIVDGESRIVPVCVYLHQGSLEYLEREPFICIPIHLNGRPPGIF